MATLTDQEQQKQTEDMTMVLEKHHNELAKDPDFFQDSNAIKNKFFSKPCTTIRIKSRIFFIIYFIGWYQKRGYL